MDAPADKTAKRLSAQEWLARNDALDLSKRYQQPAQLQMRIPADRTVLRR